MKVFDKANNASWILENGCNFLLGCNGSGKTTLLDIIAKITDDENLIVTGNDDVIYMNQNAFFFDRLSVKDNISFFLRLKGIFDRNDYVKNFNSDMDNPLDIDAIWNKQIGHLSGGEKKLVYFFTVLALDAEWYILDEPFAGTDRDIREKMLSIINKKLQRGKNFIIVSHITECLDKLIYPSFYHVADLPIQWKYKKNNEEEKNYERD